MSAREAQLVAQEVHQEQPGLDLLGDLYVVDRHRDFHRHAFPSRVAPLAAASIRSTERRNVRRVSSCARCRLYSAVPRVSVTGLQCWEASSPARLYRSSDGRWPRSNSPTPGMPVVLGPTAASPTRASLI